ncbi:hypothetical protein [Magnetospirillum sulfuroxidans]|uniref:Uncharacterized protein n=1 Tax=Magnetospirillum sulfuroxidans TaxID=611300 RepID=A0ABS5IAJ8_9PROT|nr:hypothetical protein [Magnetospirillum sulfuroxidans]MBR9971415.1 hypothetical protein [Magnetospirillum sulfuroxidans]
MARHPIPPTRYPAPAAAVAQPVRAAPVKPVAGHAIPPTRYGSAPAMTVQAKTAAAIPPTRFGPAAAARPLVPGRCLQAMEMKVNVPAKDPFASVRMKLKMAGIGDVTLQDEIIAAAQQAAANKEGNATVKKMAFEGIIRQAVLEKTKATAKKSAPRTSPANCLHFALIMARKGAGGASILDAAIDWAGESAKVMAWVQGQQKVPLKDRVPYTIAGLCTLVFIAIDDAFDDQPGIVVGAYDKTTTLGEVTEEEREIQDAHYFFGGQGTFHGVPSVADQNVADVAVDGLRFAQKTSMEERTPTGLIKGRIVVSHWL